MRLKLGSCTKLLRPGNPSCCKCPALLCRCCWQNPRRGIKGIWGVPRVHTIGTNWRCGTHNSLERPYFHFLRQGRPFLSYGMHHCPQAFWTNLSLCFVSCPSSQACMYIYIYMWTNGSIFITSCSFHKFLQKKKCSFHKCKTNLSIYI